MYKAVIGAYLCISAFCIADTFIVDQNESFGDFTSIQEAIDYSWHGDKIIVNPGLYQEDLHYNSRAITVTSTNPDDPGIVAETIIHGSVYFDFMEDYNSIIIGFTLDKVICNGTSPTISQNTFSSGGTYAIEGNFNAMPTISYNRFENLSDKIAIYKCNGPIIGNIIKNNNFTKQSISSDSLTLGAIQQCHGLIESNDILNNSFIRQINWPYGEPVINMDIEIHCAGVFDCDGEIRKNQIINNTIKSIITLLYDVNNGNYSIRSCDLKAYGGGLYGCDGYIHQNEISHNIASCMIQGSLSGKPVEFNTLSSLGAGLYNCNGTINNNQISHNSTETVAILSVSYLKGSFELNGPAIACCTANITSNYIYENTTKGQINGTINKWESAAVYACIGNTSNNQLISNDSSALENCEGLIANNMIEGNYGHGINTCTASIVNNIFIGNKGSAINDCDTTVKNNIFAYGNIGIKGECNNSYNCFWANQTNFHSYAHAKIGDFVSDPKFATDGYWDPNSTQSDDSDDFWVSGDYHLKSEAGRWEPVSEYWVMDAVTSRCIDAGDPSEPINQELNPNGGRANIGAYGGTLEASKSINGDGDDPTPECINPPSMDTNNDCKIDFIDFVEFAAQWMACGYDIQEACWE